ncbi:1299_t:CDS:2 [Paraglomus occultum]|uniref:N-alpha-acetyltransferase 40 n=1 Tax=Paraglomus occultum TaxID=144539 RepID=A0A9N8W3V2_9GLOM|nr:1299_t:CDS:2 [Paraglomus occultum]
MAPYHDSSYNPKEKRKEMRERHTRYIIAFNDNDIPIGFLLFQFLWLDDDEDDDAEIEVIYCLEIQMIDEVRGKGLGTFLMNVLEDLGRYWGMKKSVLTAWKGLIFLLTKEQLTFIATVLGKYIIDGTSPSKYLSGPEATSFNYEILSKVL